MPKKSKKRSVRQEAPPRTRRLKLPAALLCCCVLLAAGYASTRYEPVRRAVGMQPLLLPAAQQGGQGGLPLAKEYIYAGGRLVATEEPGAAPTPTPVGHPPTNLIATASFPANATTEVRLTWAEPSGGAPLSYVVERASVRVSDGVQTAYATLGQPLTTLPTPAAPYLDPSAEQGMVYAYRVSALYGGGQSGYSNQDVATTFRYTGDDPLVGAGDPLRPASVVRATDLTELRGVVAAVRKLAGSGAASWNENPAPQSGGQILAAHFAELRAQLNPALEALGIEKLPEPEPAGIAATQPVRAVHIQHVREKVR